MENSALRQLRPTFMQTRSQSSEDFMYASHIYNVLCLLRDKFAFLSTAHQISSNIHGMVSRRLHFTNDGYIIKSGTNGFDKTLL